MAKPIRLPSGRELDLTAPGADYGAAHIEERLLAKAIPDPVLRQRREPLAKALGVTGCWGIFARADHRDAPRPVVEETTAEAGKSRKRRRYPATATVEAIGPNGEALAQETSTPEEAGPLTLPHIAAAVPAANRAIGAMVRYDIEVGLGGTIAAVATDSFAVPATPEARLIACPGGAHRLPDGSEAILSVATADLLGVIHRFDPLLHPNGGSAFKEECESLTKPTFGLVCGTNKLLLGRDEGDGFHIVRSSDTGLGDHYIDPTGTGNRLDDGRAEWPAVLEDAVLADTLARGPGAAPRVPPELPPWADQPAVRPGVASAMPDVQWLREQLGDQTIPATTPYIQAAAGPSCPDDEQHPSPWPAQPWMQNGEPARIAVLGNGGELIMSH
ncbi:MAG: hypothetical protein ACYDBS_05965, partial [Acidimicrobiales bacterium]